ncbi:MAG: large conductance mechanosensitive channel protein MscL [Candidatus Doudnabacteria bacterium CG10_big_fil_rev_8_21_14_0_10_41_10]|uniref:Large-conductance mechanosensitive channel n=1 Tax=Candidatus Doudnabacteria bacterium CG10_big_fil_rev_8_21_14_0_10_41_10 TaxID=1974551 RepID=A0A2H0VDX0_9BACT|nr:MAG: large conductance mechanosensitive channel protein MscL [Candidatus Doudnabacteria bacterium CG10_big_fil_rev_8_21_14_0_10_41_10]
MLKEFKEFAMKGNVLDLAIAVIIGVAFGKIITSLVNDIIMPPIGLLLGGVDFSNLTITLKKAASGVEAVTLNYGVFINSVIDFLIVALTIFLAVKQFNRFKKPAPIVAPATKNCPMCKTAIHKDATKCPSCTADI